MSKDKQIKRKNRFYGVSIAIIFIDLVQCRNIQHYFHYCKSLTSKHSTINLYFIEIHS